MAFKTVKQRTTFDIPGVGKATYLPGEEMPGHYVKHAPESTFEEPTSKDARTSAKSSPPATSGDKSDAK
ncbi:MAG: hypothetical protein AAF170_07665 [Bacteroidota bacterium]